MQKLEVHPKTAISRLDIRPVTNEVAQHEDSARARCSILIGKSLSHSEALPRHREVGVGEQEELELERNKVSWREGGIQNGVWE